jgi:hypothetical protein
MPASQPQRACQLRWLVPFRLENSLVVGHVSGQSSERSLIVDTLEDLFLQMRRVWREVWQEFGERVAVTLDGFSRESLYVAEVGDLWHFYYMKLADEPDAELSLRSVDDQSATGTTRILTDDFKDIPNSELVARAQGEVVVREWFEGKRLSQAIRWKII